MPHGTRQQLGIIGMGGRGRSHYRNLSENFSDRAEVIAVADPLLDSAAVEEIPDTRCFRDYHDLLALPELDGVIVATHEAAHVDVCLAALRAGKAVLLEKAAAADWAEAVGLYRAVRSSTIPFMLALNLRHFPAVRVLKAALDQCAIDQVAAVTVYVNAGSHWGANCFRRYYHDRTLCGDLVLSKLTHDTDLIQHLLGTRARSVTGHVAKVVFVPRPGAGPDCDHCGITEQCPEYVDLSDPSAQPRNPAAIEQRRPPLNICPFTRPSTSHDTATFSGIFENGVVFTFVFTTAGPVYERRLLFNGTAGQIDSILHGPTGPRVVVHRTNGQPEVQHIPSVTGGHGGADPSLMAAFLDYLDEGPTAPSEPESILTSMLIPAGGIAASETGRVIDLAAWYHQALA